MSERLHKVLAHAGVASRRAAERMIVERRVRVNGAVVLELGTQVDPARDQIEVDGRRLDHVASSGSHVSHHYEALNKPVGVVSTASDPQRRPTVVDLVQSGRADPGGRPKTSTLAQSLGSRPRLYPVGRLDIDSEGLVLLTDDGELTFRLTQARFGVEKEYHVVVEGANFAEHLIPRLRGGVMLDDGPARAVRASLLSTTARGAEVRVVLVEGRQRQVRRMLAVLGYRVERLQRVRIGPLLLGDLASGQHRPLRRGEVEALRASVGLDA
jgi:23S rRNA pseudouridine2605 synthase